jgi:hypothetical protein
MLCATIDLKKMLDTGGIPKRLTQLVPFHNADIRALYDLSKLY